MNGREGAGTTIQAVRRAVDVLFCFDAVHRTLDPAQVAALLGMNRTTAWRYLQSLAQCGLVVPLGDARHSLGPRVLRLAETYVSQWGDLAVLAAPLLTELRDGTGETAALHVRQGWSRVVVTQVESKHELRRTYADIGEPIPLHLGAPSMAILAWLPSKDIDGYINSAFAGDRGGGAAVRSEVEKIRRAGYAVSRQVRTSNVASVAAPVFDADSRIIASINVSGPMHRLDALGVSKLAKAVVEAASQLSTRLGHVSDAEA